jgi:hypothetical protein
VFVDHEQLATISAAYDQRELDFAILNQEMSTLSMLLRDSKEAKEGGDKVLFDKIMTGVYALLGLSQTSH